MIVASSASVATLVLKVLLLFLIQHLLPPLNPCRSARSSIAEHEEVNSGVEPGLPELRPRADARHVVEAARDLVRSPGLRWHRTTPRICVCLQYT